MNLNKNRYWIVVANGSKLKIFASNSPLYQSRHDLSFILELDHNESRLKSHDLEKDKPGRYKMHESGGSAYERVTDTKIIEKNQFAREIAGKLKHAKSLDQYEQILLIVPKQFYGILKTYIDHNVADSIYKLIYKDYVNSTTEDLTNMIFGEINGV